MNVLKNVTTASITAALLFAGAWQSASADKLDDVIEAGKVRCGVVLDFPPIGYRDANNDPAGFDVEYCKDLAKAMDVDFEIIPVTWAERLPVIVNNRADVVFGGTSDTLERAKTVGFTIPYAIYYAQAVVGKDPPHESGTDGEALLGERLSNLIHIEVGLETRADDERLDLLSAFRSGV